MTDTINPDNEIWRIIPGFGNQYEASNLGQIRKVSDHYILEQCEKKTGYVYVHLRHKGKDHCKRVNRLVALAHIPNPHNKPQVHHKDGNRANNRVENLEWLTAWENVIEAVKRKKKKQQDKDNAMHCGSFYDVWFGARAADLPG